MRVWTQTITVVAALASLTLAHLVHENLPPLPEPAEYLDPPDPVTMGLLTVGHNRLAADLTWLEALQYYGDSVYAKTRYPRLSGLLDTVVALDPEFRYAYLFGGLALTETLSGVDAADSLLSRGQVLYPRDWHFPFYIGINAYFYREDNARAAEYFAQASQLPGAPPFLSTFAVKLRLSSGDCDQSLGLIDRLQRESRDPTMHRRLEERRRYVIWECNFQLLEVAVTEYRRRHGRPPSGLNDLVAGGLIRGIPPDPYGGHYRIDADGRVISTTRKRRLKVGLPAHHQGQ